MAHRSKFIYRSEYCAHVKDIPDYMKKLEFIEAVCKYGLDDIMPPEDWPYSIYKLFLEAKEMIDKDREN